MPPPNRPPVRRPGGRANPPPRSDTEPSQLAVDVRNAPEVSVGGRRRVARRPKEPAPKKSKAPLVLVLLLLVGVAAAGYWKLNQKPPPPPPTPAVDPTIALKVLFQEGKNLVRAGKWADAKAKFTEVLDQAPDLEGGAVKTYLAACEKEIPNQRHFDAAQAALDKNEVGTAHRELAAVSADTQQLNRRDTLQLKLGEVFKSRIAEGGSLAQSGDPAKMKKLKALAEDLLVVRPDDRDALEFKATADRFLRPRTDKPVELPKDDPGIRVMQLYAGGDSGGAMAAAAACAAEAESCKSLEAKMSELNGLLKRIEGLQPNELEAALRLDRSITGGRSSPQAKPIATRIGAVFYPKASNARAKADWPLTMQYALKVVDADPGHTGAAAIVSEGRGRAHELYLRCYQQKQTEPESAAPLCRDVVAMLPPGDPERTKAENVLQSLGQR